jgi:hypothetical protein
LGSSRPSTSRTRQQRRCLPPAIPASPFSPPAPPPQYRLNFHGRVTIPSVKNYQLTPVSDIHDIVCQFGKVGDDRFHLDYKRPLNAFQAFSVALTQFSL